MDSPAAPATVVDELEAPTRIAIAMACFNRRDGTLRCLESLYAQQNDAIALAVHLLDDASSDGTAAAVSAAFPQTNVLGGTGHLFWGGGMRQAMAAATEKPLDFVLWLNDDVTLAPNALSNVLDAHRLAKADHGDGPHVIVGATADPATGAITYSGFRRRNTWHPAQLKRIAPIPGQLTPCDTMNGNCVLIPAELVRRIGLLDAAFPHQLGDIDYGYRARAAGASLWIAPDPIGTCAANPNNRPWLKPPTIGARLAVLNSPRGLPFRAWITFLWRHAGLLGLPILAQLYARQLLAIVRL